MQTTMFQEELKSECWFVKENCQYFVVDNEKKCKRLAEILSKSSLISLDVETTSLNPSTGILVGFSVCVEPGKAFYIPINHKFGKNLDLDLYEYYLKPLIETIPILGHNLKFDYKFIKAFLDTRLLCKEDTFVIAKLIDCFDFNGLKPLSELLYEYNVLELRDILEKFSISINDLDSLLPEEICDYCCQDTDLTLRLYNTFVSDYSWKSSFIYKEEIKLVESLARMELRGVKINIDFLNKSKIEYEQEIEEFDNQIIKLLEIDKDININSNVMISNAILEKFPKMKKFMAVTEKAKQIKMNEDYLTKYEKRFNDLFGDSFGENIFTLLLRRKKITSLLNKYINPWISIIEDKKSDIIYTNFNSLGTDTGRLSSNDPNLQNVTKKIRCAVVPRDGYYFLSMDYAQVEYRIFLAMAGLDSIIEEVNRGIDIHLLAASLLYERPKEEISKELRDNTKTLNFGILYGMSAFSLANALNISIEQAEELMCLYNRRFLKNTKWFRNVINFAKKNGYVMTSFGRKRRIDNINVEFPSDKTDQQKMREVARLFGMAKRKAINTPVQGTAADIMKMGINKLFSFIDNESLDIHPVITVHDDIVLEINKKYEQESIINNLKGCLEIFYKDKIKLIVDSNCSDISWGNLKG